jgi:hypothetical protein
LGRCHYRGGILREGTPREGRCHLGRMEGAREGDATSLGSRALEQHGVDGRVLTVTKYLF